MNTNQETNWDRLVEFAERTMKARGTPGVAVGILHQGETSSGGFGVTSIAHPLPVTEETFFQIGSITKTVTSSAVLRLVEMGKLELDAPVRSYVPDFRVVDETASTQVTIRHLLTHMGGWEGDFFHDTGAGDDALSKYVTAMADLVQLAPLGTVWSYNNAGFCLAGHIIEIVTDKSFQAAVKELFLEPLGLPCAFFDPGDVMVHRFAVGHNVSPAGAEVAHPWPLPRYAYPAGGITCRVPDLLRYARFHLGDGQSEDGDRLLSAEFMTSMHTAHVTVWNKEAWGLGWSVDETHGARLVSHGGGTNGQVSLLLLVPEHDFAIAILTNADRGGFVTRDVSRWALKHYLGLEISEPAPLELPEEQLVAYTGRYSNPFSEIELGLLGGRLVGQINYKAGFPTQDTPPPPPPPPMALAPCETDRLTVLDGPFKDGKADIIRRPDGSIGWLRASGRLHACEG